MIVRLAMTNLRTKTLPVKIMIRIKIQKKIIKTAPTEVLIHLQRVLVEVKVGQLVHLRLVYQANLKMEYIKALLKVMVEI